MLSDAPRDRIDVLEAFGEALGMAFQLSDDIMDLTASQVELGKEPGVDMKEGVYTLPVLHSLSQGEDREELARLLTAGPPDGERLDRAIEIIRGRREHRSRPPGRDRGGPPRRGARPAPSRGQRRTALIQLSNFLAVRCGAEQAA